MAEPYSSVRKTRFFGQKMSLKPAHWAVPKSLLCKVWHKKVPIYLIFCGEITCGHIAR